MTSPGGSTEVSRSSDGTGERATSAGGASRDPQVDSWATAANDDSGIHLLAKVLRPREVRGEQLLQHRPLPKSQGTRWERGHTDIVPC